MGVLGNMRAQLGRMLLGVPGDMSLAVLPKSGRGGSELKSAITTAAEILAYQDGRPVWTDWDPRTAIRDGLKQSTWLAIGLKVIADAASSAPWFTTVKGARVEGHPLTTLLSNPNPFMDGSDLTRRNIYHLTLAGNIITEMNLVNGTPLELWPLNPSLVKPIANRKSFISSYQFTALDGTQPRTLPTQSIIHVQYPDPEQPLWGMSPLKSMGKTIDTEVAMVSWQKAQLQKSCIPSGILAFKGSLNEAQFKAYRKMLKEQAMGPDNARVPYLLGDDVQWINMQSTLAEMDWSNSRKLTREELLGGLGVPPVLVGVLDHATYSNYETARLVLWEITVIPILAMLRGVYNRALAPKFGPDVQCNFDLTNISAMLPQLLTKLNIVDKLWTKGVPMATLNERFQLGLPRFEGDELSVLPSGMIPSSMTIAQFPDEINPTADPATDPGQTAGDAAAKDFESDMEHRNELFGEFKADDDYIPSELGGVNLGSAESKAMYWRSFERQRIGWYGVLAGKSRSIMAAERSRVVSAVKSGDKNVDALIDKSKANWQKTLLTTYKQVIRQFGGATAISLGGKVQGKGTFRNYFKKDDSEDGDEFLYDPWDEGIRKAVNGFVGDAITAIDGATKLEVRRVIGAGLAAGKSNVEIAKELEALYDGWDRYRSMRIARTEVISASNFGSKSAAEQSGIVEEREWVDSKDDRVRDTHQELGGTIVAMDESYTVQSGVNAGAALEFPGDPHAPAGERIHCRCVEVFHTR